MLVAPSVRRHLRGHDACVVVERMHDTAKHDNRLHREPQDQPTISCRGEAHASGACVPASETPDSQLLDRAVFTCLKTPPHRRAHQGG